MKTTHFSAADYLETPEDVAFFLEAAFEDASPEHIAKALGEVAKSKGMAELERKTGLTRAGLYKALSENGDPKLSTLLSVMSALGLKLSVRAV